MGRQQYAYATGLIRALEPKLLDRTDLERMIDARDAPSAFKVFYDTDYADNLLDVGVQDFEKALDDDLKQTRDLFFQIIPERNVLKLLFLEFDFHNIKVLIKAKSLARDLNELLIDLGTQDLDILKKYILKDAKEKMTDFELAGKLDLEIKKIIDLVLEQIELQPQAHLIDALIDKQYFQLLKSIAKKINNSFIKEFVEFQIDFANLKIVLRARNLEKTKQEIGDELIEGGRIKTKDLLSNFDQDLDDIIKTFAHYYSQKRIREAFENFLKEEKLWFLEKELEEYKLEIIRQAKKVTYGLEVVVGFFYAKKNANSNIRSIMKGKINNIDKEETRKRLREIY